MHHWKNVKQVMKYMNKISKKKRARERRKDIRRHKASVLLVGGAMVLLVGVVGVSGMRLSRKNAEYQVQETKLQNELKEEEERAKEIEEMKNHVGTDEYVKEIAKEKLGLAGEDEIIFEPEK